jgi:hypothetical protein
VKRIKVQVDCDDSQAELLAKRLKSYIVSIGALNVQIDGIEDLAPPMSNK